jgi:hypothetical protein
MAVPDWSSSYSTSNLSGSYAYEDFILHDDGSISNVTPYSGASDSYGIRTRGGHSRNPVVKDGYTTWRSPSAYSRSIWRSTYYPGSTLAVHIGSDKFRYGRRGLVNFANHFNNADTFGILSGSADDINCDQQAKASLYDQLNQNRVDMGTNIIQTRQSVEDVSSILSDICKLYRGFRSDNASLIRQAILGNKGIAKALSDRYLLWIYGIKPVLSDLYNAHNLLRKKMVHGQLFRVRGHASCSQSRSWPKMSETGEKLDNQTETLKHIYVGTLQISSVTMIQLSQWGLSNPLSVAWEVLPFSFVIDWLVPVGSTLEALTAPLGYSVKGMTHSRVHECTSQQSWMCGPYLAQGQFFTGTPFKRIVASFDFSRSLVPGFPLPGLYFKSPFSSTHVANALALYTSLRR